MKHIASHRFTDAFRERKLPEYSSGEEKANMFTHIAGGIFAFVSLLLCTAFGAWNKNTAGVISGILYGTSMITVYVISSVYHGLDPDTSTTGKKILQVIDHCDIYGLIAGTFAPIALTRMRHTHPVLAVASFTLVCVTALIGMIFTAVDFKKYRLISYGAYFVSGWSVLLTTKAMKETYSARFLLLLIAGGAVYTLGMVFFILQCKGKKYAHTIFHIFILAGSVIQFIPIFKYCILL